MEINKIKPKGVDTKLPNMIEIISRLKTIKTEENGSEIEEAKQNAEEECSKSVPNSNKKAPPPPSSRTNKNKGSIQPMPKPKAINIINIEDSEDEKKNKNKKKNFDEEEKDETNSMPANPHDYYNEKGNEEREIDDLREVKLPRKTESMHIEFSDIDRRIIQSVLSDEFGILCLFFSLINSFFT